MANRTKEEILDQIVNAVASAAQHYGPALNDRGLAWVRTQLASHNWHTDACYTVDCRESDPYIDFDSRIIQPDGWDKFPCLQTGKEGIQQVAVELVSMRKELDLLVCDPSSECDVCDNNERCYELTEALDRLGEKV